MNIQYRFDIMPQPAQIIALYDTAGLPRPTDDADRIKRIFDGSNLVLTAWEGDVLVGVCRCITDWAWSCYLADLAVHPEYKNAGIGKSMVQATKEKLGDEVMILLLSVPTAMEYYPRIGFIKEDRAFSILRKK
jgi:ribosomal protein S18 acetylase RimI-like enzyme